MPDGSCFPRLGLWYRTMSMGVGSCALYLHGFPEPYGIYHKVYVRFLISGGSHNLKLKKLCYICIGNNLIKVKTNLFIPTINSRLLQRCNRFFKWCKICLKPVFCPCISVQVACTGVRTATIWRLARPIVGAVPASRAFLCPYGTQNRTSGELGAGVWILHVCRLNASLIFFRPVPHPFFFDLRNFKNIFAVIDKSH